MYVLHTMPDTAGLTVRLLLSHLGQPFVVETIDRATDHRDRPEYRALHPLGQVPALVTAEGTIFETAAILLWLADRHGGVAPAPDAPERGDFLKWLFFTTTNVHATVMSLYYPDRYTGDPGPNELYLRTNARRLHEALALVDKAVSLGPAWCPPDRPSVIGLYLAVLLRWLGQADRGSPGHVDPAAFPSLMAIAGMLEALPAAREAAEAEGLEPSLFTAPA